MAVTRDDSGGRSAAGDPPGSQGALFEADETLGAGREVDSGSAEVGYRGPTACSAAGITYRQLDYWARTCLVEPSVRAAHGSGSQRLYSFRDILVLKVVKRLLDTGISLQQIRAVDRGGDHRYDDLARQRFGIRHLPDLQHVRAAGLGDDDCAHLTNPSSVVPRR